MACLKTLQLLKASVAAPSERRGPKGASRQAADARFASTAADQTILCRPLQG